MIKKTMRVNLENGLEARPVAVLVQLASQYEGSTVYIEAEGKRVNAKSIMGMMSLGLGNGANVTVVADGKDEQNAVEEIEKFLGGKE